MGRAARFRLVCNALALLMIVVGLRQLMDPALVLADPLLASAELNCSPCRYEADPVRLVDPALRKMAWQTPGVEERILERLQLPHVPWLLFAAEAVRSIPLFFLFLGLAVGIRSFAKTGFTFSSVKWFRLAAAASLLWALAGPLSRGFRASALDAAVTGVDKFRISLEMYSLLQGVMISGAALVALWAVEEAMAMRSNLEDYV